MRPAVTDDDIARRKKIWRSNKRKGFIHFHRNCSAEVIPKLRALLWRDIRSPLIANHRMILGYRHAIPNAKHMTKAMDESCVHHSVCTTPFVERSGYHRCRLGSALALQWRKMRQADC
jgi:hypothetical protein